MRSFRKEWFFAVNDCGEGSVERGVQAIREEKAALAAYWKDLESLKPRISSPLFQALRHPDETRLSNSRIIELSMTDFPSGASSTASGRKRRPQSHVRLLLHSEDGKIAHQFKFRTVSQFSVDYPTEKSMGSWPLSGTGRIEEMEFDAEREFGYAYRCELSATEDKTFRFEMLLHTGGTILIQSREIFYARSSVAGKKRSQKPMTKMKTRNTARRFA